ncbi:MAG: LodA/GoxA family CTQ-dependent oxidase, partial [Kangiellaceae bacterium]|nr:LodA/GoxA family CTQ-dependent oxidase [Kangiellaceae bacterium]
GVLANLTGGAFCPGAEAGWIMRNPGIYAKPYRIFGNRNYFPIGTGRLPGRAPFQPPALTLKGDISGGLEPGDITKFSALPWQADFNECSTQNINVSYSSWNVTYGNTTNNTTSKNDEISETLWWPAYRPMQVYQKNSDGKVQQLNWSRGIPATNAGDLKMVSAWRDLGFVLGEIPTQDQEPYELSYFEVERKILSDNSDD